MLSNDFEKAFSDYLETQEYDRMQNALFTFVRQAFLAGWLSANGKPPVPTEIFKIVKGGTNTEK